MHLWCRTVVSYISKSRDRSLISSNENKNRMSYTKFRFRLSNIELAIHVTKGRETQGKRHIEYTFMETITP